MASKRISRTSPASASLPSHPLGVDARGVRIPRDQSQVADSTGAHVHILDTSQLNVLTSKKIKRKQQRATRRSANNLPETMLTNAEMNSVGPVTRQSYTTAHDAFVAWARTHRFRLGADHASLDRLLVRYLDEELLASESAAVARLALFGPIPCRGIPRHPEIMSHFTRAPRGFVRDEHGFSKDPLPLEAMVSDVGERPPEAGPLVGQTSRPCACDVVRLLHEATEMLKILSRGVLAPRSAEVPISVCCHCAERGCKRRDDSTALENGQFDDTVMAGLLRLLLEVGRGHLLRLQAACPTDLWLLSPLRLSSTANWLSNWRPRGHD